MSDPQIVSGDRYGAVRTRDFVAGATAFLNWLAWTDRGETGLFPRFATRTGAALGNAVVVLDSAVEGHHAWREWSDADAQLAKPQNVETRSGLENKRTEAAATVMKNVATASCGTVGAFAAGAGLAGVARGAAIALIASGTTAVIRLGASQMPSDLRRSLGRLVLSEAHPPNARLDTEAGERLSQLRSASWTGVVNPQGMTVVV